MSETYVPPEVSFEFFDKFRADVWHTWIQCGNQTRVEGQKIQSKSLLKTIKSKLSMSARKKIELAKRVSGINNQKKSK